MNQFKSIPMYELPLDFPITNDDLEFEYLRASRAILFYWTMPILAELACAGMAALFYLVLLPSEPVYLVWLTLGAYLFTGAYMAGVRNPWRKLKTEPILWWRLAIAVLGWPIHEVIVAIHEDILYFYTIAPRRETNAQMLHQIFRGEILRSLFIWLATFLISTGIAVFIAKAGLFFGS